MHFSHWLPSRLPLCLLLPRQNGVRLAIREDVVYNDTVAIWKTLQGRTGVI